MTSPSISKIWTKIILIIPGNAKPICCIVELFIFIILAKVVTQPWLDQVHNPMRTTKDSVWYWPQTGPKSKQTNNIPIEIHNLLRNIYFEPYIVSKNISNFFCEYDKGKPIPLQIIRKQEGKNYQKLSRIENNEQTRTRTRNLLKCTI